MKTLALLAILAAVALGGCVNAEKQNAEWVRIRVRLDAVDALPISAAHYDVRGWIDRTATSGSVTLAEGYCVKGYFEVVVPRHESYRIEIGGVQASRDRWLGIRDIDLSDLPEDGAVSIGVRWQRGPVSSRW